MTDNSSAPTYSIVFDEDPSSLNSYFIVIEKAWGDASSSFVVDTGLPEKVARSISSTLRWCRHENGLEAMIHLAEKMAMNNGLYGQFDSPMFSEGPENPFTTLLRQCSRIGVTALSANGLHALRVALEDGENIVAEIEIPYPSREEAAVVAGRLFVYLDDLEPKTAMGEIRRLADENGVALPEAFL